MSVTPQGCDFPGVQTIIELRSRRNQGAWESRFYAASFPAQRYSLAEIARMIREHWSVENKNHWRKDATLDEDRLRVRNSRIASNLILLRNLVLHYHTQYAEEGMWLPQWIEQNQDSKRIVTRMVTTQTIPK